MYQLLLILYIVRLSIIVNCDVYLHVQCKNTGCIKYIVTNNRQDINREYYSIECNVISQ